MFPTSGAWGLASNPKRRGCAERHSAALFTAAKRATSPARIQMSLQICMLDGDFTANMVGLRPEIWGLISGHLRNRFIGGTYYI